MKRILNILTISSILFLSACSLEELPKRDVLADQAIENIEDAQAALYGTYAAIRDYYSRGGIALGDVMTDETFAVTGYESHKKMQAYTFSSAESEVSDLWTRLYRVVNNANNILLQIDGIAGNASAKNQIKGQALGLRAAAYMELCKWFSTPYTVNANAPGVPIKLSTSATEQPGRSTVSEVFSYIEADLKSAAQLLKSHADLTILSYNSVQAYLARFYLYKGDYSNAIVSATEVINSGKYSLCTSAETISSMWLNDSGSEIIFMLGYTETNLGGSLGNDYFMRTFDPSTNKIQNKPAVYYIPSSSFLNVYNTFGPANSSKTADADIRYKDGVYFLNGASVGSWNAKLCYKYPGNPYFINKANLLNVNQPKLIRLPELYLIRAEAYAELGNNAAARADYNLLRKNRIEGYVYETALNGSSLKEEIFNERCRELCFEGHYWYDIKRHQRGFTRTPTAQEQTYIDITAATLTVPVGSTRWLLPIPYGEVAGNPTIEPNPGY